MKQTAVVLALALVLAACSNKDEASEVAQEAQKAQIPLAYAPAGTAFVLGNLEPAPQSYIDAITPMAQSIKTALIETLDRAREVHDAEAQPNDTAQRDALIALLQQRLQHPETLAGMGLDFNALAAMYEIDAVPVLRLELADAERFRAFIAEVEAQAGQALPQAELDGQPYWHLPVETKTAGADTGTDADASSPANANANANASAAASADPAPAAQTPRLVMAVVGKHLVATLDPQDPSTPLARLLGLQRPAQSVLESGELAQVNQQYGYQPYGGSALVDTRRVLALLLPPEGQHNWLSRQREAQQGAPLSEVCRSEIETIAAKAPRLVGGTTAMDGKHLRVGAVLELEPALAGELQKLTAPVPGLGSDRSGVEFGFSLKIDQLAGFLQAQSAAVQVAPYQCELLQPLNQSMANMTQNLAGLYAVSGWITGARASISELDIEQQLVRGTVLLASPNPVGLIGMAQGFVPELARLGLTADGKARQLQSPMTAMVNGGADPLWVAMNEHAVGIGIGADKQAALEAALQASPATPAPLIYYGIDGASYVKMFGQLNEQTLADSASSAAEEQANYVLWPLMKSAVDLYRSIGFVSTHYVLTGRGLELSQEMTLQ